jgi:ribosomal-protein-alanine N-acetyltransferase
VNGGQPAFSPRSSPRTVQCSAVRELCRLTATLYRLGTLCAAGSHENIASQRVPAKAAFVPADQADPADLGGKAGIRYRRDPRG